MIGGNEMLLNHATLIQAVQFWLEQKVLRDDAAKVVVSRVAVEDSGQHPQFRVHLTAQEAK